ncbi:MAG: hypothetical protein JXR76_28175 [Deltaproteobacteria bacterium]|nr:hypothetical protein [Deltaproteobacteria bacterium]
MNNKQNRRAQFRRYSDRRVTALLELHEILFYEPVGAARNMLLMNTINEDYQTDRVALVQTVSEKPSCVTVLSASEKWPVSGAGTLLEGEGIQRIVLTHQHFEGALTLSKFRSSSAFSISEWQSLWERDLGAPASALLSVPVFPRKLAPAFLWLVADSGSREWSSHDRDLSEEEALMMARVIQQGMLGISR